MERKIIEVASVGAGDCFTAWLSVGMAEKLPLEFSIRRALQAASLSVTRIGTQRVMPYRHEIDRA
jgi:ribokinase